MPAPLLLAAPAAVVFALIRDYQIQQAGLSRADLEGQIFTKLTDIERRFTEWMREQGGDAYWLLENAFSDRARETNRFQLTHNDLVESVGAELIGAGGTRAVLSIGPSESAPGGHPGFVLKLSRLKNWGHRDNAREVEVWDWAVKYAATNPLASELIHVLVPVLMHAEDYSWLVMDYAAPLDTMASREKWRENEDRVDYMETLGLQDLGYRNLGVHDGVIKTFDYGLHFLELDG